MCGLVASSSASTAFSSIVFSYFSARLASGASACSRAELAQRAPIHLEAVRVHDHKAQVAEEDVADEVACASGPGPRAGVGRLRTSNVICASPNSKTAAAYSASPGRPSRRTCRRRRYRRRPPAAAHPPQADVQFVHPLVADIAVARIPEPVPVIGVLVFAVRLHLRGAEEQIPIEACRNRGIGRVADRKAAAEAEPARMIHLPDRALAQQLHRCFLCVIDRPCEPTCTIRCICAPPRPSVSPSNRLWLAGFST